MRSALGFFSIFALIVAALLLVVRLVSPGQIQAQEEQAQLIYLVLILFLVGGGVFGASRSDIKLALRQGLTWIAIFLLVVIVYSFQDEFLSLSNRVKRELLPASPLALQTQKTETSAVVAVRKSNDGHFWANATVNRAHIRFLVDTGASSIALTLQDAKRAGINIDDLEFSIPISTASGQTFGAYVTLEKVSIGQITLREVEAVVLQDGLDNSLLGMSFLGRLQKFEASRNQLILKK